MIRKRWLGQIETACRLREIKRLRKFYVLAEQLNVRTISPKIVSMGISIRKRINYRIVSKKKAPVITPDKDNETALFTLKYHYDKR